MMFPAVDSLLHHLVTQIGMINTAVAFQWVIAEVRHQITVRHRQ